MSLRTDRNQTDSVMYSTHTKVTRSPGAPPLRIVAGLVGVVVVGLTLLAAAAELTLRILDRPKEVPAGWAWRGDSAELNELGFRGHRAPGHVDQTILLVGDSQVETTHPFNSMPEVHLAAALRELTGRDIRVVSIGSTGWGQDQQLLALRRALPGVRPSMVVLWFTPRNDLWNNTFPTHMPKDGRPKPTFWLTGATLRGPHVAWGQAVPPPEPRLLRAWRRLRQSPLYTTDADWESKLPSPYRFVGTPSGQERSLVEFMAAQHQLTPAEVAPRMARENFENEKTHFSIALTPRSPRLEYSIRLTRALLGEIAQLCEQHGAGFVAFYTDNNLRLPAQPTHFDVGGRIVVLSSVMATSVVRDVLAGVPAVALTGYRDDFMMSKTDGHLNEDGNRYFMTALAKYLAERYRQHL